MPFICSASPRRRSLGLSAVPGSVSLLVALMHVASPAILRAGEAGVMSQDREPRTTASGDPGPEFAKHAEPAKHHDFLKGFAGTWAVRAKAWPTPDAAPVESESVSRNEMILGGRFLLERIEGAYLGSQIETMQILGYDNFKKVFDFTSISSMGTATYRATGALDETGRVLTLVGEIDDPMGKRPVRYVYRVADTDHYFLTAYNTLPDGREVVAVETSYLRKK